MVINSQKNFLKFVLEAEGDGQLSIYLRSNDHRLEGKRIPIHMTYKQFTVNGESILPHPIIVDHDHPYIYKTNVLDGEKLTIYLEWIPY